MYKRQIVNTLTYAATKFPVVTLTGPRQSGKTTLVRNLFADKPYVSLEDLDSRDFALKDPRGFLAHYADGAVIDEAQYAPDLFSYIQGIVDLQKKMGAFILTGSQNFLLLERITQSLAGRSCILQLLPLSLDELGVSSNQSPFLTIFEGLYPGLHENKIDPQIFYRSYLQTYVERDVRTLKNIKDLTKFRTFLSLCAGRVGQLLNLSSLGNDAGIDQESVKAWLSLLEASYIVFRLYPHHANFNKRLTKQAKLYFFDTGLLSHLLGIESEADISRHFARGPLFENFVALELIKNRMNLGRDPRIYFWRDHVGHEVDFILDTPNGLIPVEVKSAQTLSKDMFSGLLFWQKISQTTTSYLVYAGSNEEKRIQGQVLPWNRVSAVYNGLS